MNEPATRLHQSFYQRYESIILGVGSIVLILALWEAAWDAKMISPLFFSGPSAIATQMVYAWTKGHLKSDLVYSGTNFILGFAGAVVAGVTLGILIGWYKKLRMLLDRR
jgi:NitT/TauT family transport system permease protein